MSEPKDFEEVYRAKVPTWVNHWRYQWDEDVRLPRPAEVVFVKYTGKPAVNVLRATLHLRPDRRPGQSIQVTHAYKIGEELFEKTLQLDKPGDYTVPVEGDPENVFIRMAVPSGSR